MSVLRRKLRILDKGEDEPVPEVAAGNMSALATSRRGRERGGACKRLLFDLSWACHFRILKGPTPSPLLDFLVQEDVPGTADAGLDAPPTVLRLELPDLYFWIMRVALSKGRGIP